jgi:hypothetical protein
MRAWLVSMLLMVSAAGHAGTLVDVQVVDRDSGAMLPVHASGDRFWVPGVPGHRYSVRLVNRSQERVLAVLSVDGVNAVSGETASTQQAGYVLSPWQQMDVEGWRKSLSEVAAFEFTSLGNSYAARTGRPANVGVIGVAVFRERRPLPVPSPRYDDIARRAPPSAAREAAGASAPSADARGRVAQSENAPIVARPQESLGTGHGQREWSAARQVAFERESATPYEVLALHYDSYENLVALGVIPQPYRGAPEPFPMGFVPDPG